MDAVPRCECLTYDTTCDCKCIPRDYRSDTPRTPPPDSEPRQFPCYFCARTSTDPYYNCVLYKCHLDSTRVHVINMYVCRGVHPDLHVSCVQLAALRYVSNATRFRGMGQDTGTRSVSELVVQMSRFLDANPLSTVRCATPGCGRFELFKGTHFLTCSRCHNVHYCSVACQRQHWEATHREECAELAHQPQLWTRRVQLNLAKAHFLNCSDPRACTGECLSKEKRWAIQALDRGHCGRLACTQPLPSGINLSLDVNTYVCGCASTAAMNPRPRWIVSLTFCCGDCRTQAAPHLDFVPNGRPHVFMSAFEGQHLTQQQIDLVLAILAHLRN